MFIDCVSCLMCILALYMELCTVACIYVACVQLCVIA